MAEKPRLTIERTGKQLAFDRKRVHAILAALEAAAGGEYTKLPLSESQDELDAVAHAVNVLIDELRLQNASTNLMR